MSTVQRPRIAFAEILFCLFVFIVSTSVLIAHDFGLIKSKYISSTFLHSSPPSPLPPSSPSIVLHSGYRHHGDRAALDDFKVPACVVLFLLTLLAFLYIRNIYGRRLLPVVRPLCRPSSRLTPPPTQPVPRQWSPEGYCGRPEGFLRPQEGTAAEQIYREMVEGACKKFVELERASAEELRRSNEELGETKENVGRLNALVKNLRQDLDLSQANLVQRPTQSAKEHRRVMEAADRKRLKVVSKVRHAQAEADALHSDQKPHRPASNSTPWASRSPWSDKISELLGGARPE
ncbi:hypothetical protein FRC04_008739 [Tulasnella sp. 424]|nr:hypothetical protein FRC04_008739 [Tulasnella sp. 424]